MIELPFESGHFRTIEVDPPWQYRDRGYNGFASVQKYRIHCPYPTMSRPELLDMAAEVRRVTNESAHLWMWTTKDFMGDALELVREWGFQHKQIWTWVKTTQSLEPVARKLLKLILGIFPVCLSRLENRDAISAIASFLESELRIPGRPTYGMGHWGRNATEFLLLGTNDRSLRLSRATTTPNYIHAPRSGHSSKPDVFYQMIAENSPEPRLSLFQRTPRPGFNNWGNELESTPLFANPIE